MNNEKIPSPIDCYKCKKGFHPNFIYTTRDGNKICRNCVLSEGILFTMKNLDKIGKDFYRNKLEDKDYPRFIKDIREY